MKRYSSWLITFISLALYVFFVTGVDMSPVEDLDIPSALGCDIEKSDNGKTIYSFPVSVYDFESEDKPISFLRIGKGATIGETREDRQLKSNKDFILGLEKIVIFSEDAASYGIKAILNVLLVNPTISDTGIAMVCKGRAEDLMKLNIKNYPSSADYIEGLIKNSKNFNFISENYTIMDLYVRVDAEGRSLALPYIVIENDLPKLTGFALFQKDKMKLYLPVKEAKIMNLLKEDDVKGVLTIEKDFEKYIDVRAKSKRKVRCYVNGNNYKFVISLNIMADLIINELYKGLDSQPEKIAAFEKDMEREVKTQCQTFIKKMQQEYKTDYLDLGRVAAAKFGRYPDIDWNKIVSSSEIEVNVNITLDRQGRGSY